MPRHHHSARRRFSFICFALLAIACRGKSETFDLVIANGRVMDPASSLDGRRHIGIRGSTIAAISESPLQGTRVIDATNHVVAPGFVDLHEHGQAEESYAMMARDGVTTALELEAGTADVAEWYAARTAGQLVNFGVSVGHIPARMRVLGDPSDRKDILPSGVGGTGSATEEQVAAMEAILRKGLDEGAVAVGAGSAYTVGAAMQEVERMFRVAAAGNASVHIHMRNGPAGLDSTIAAAKASGARLHIVHVNSSGGDSLSAFLSKIKAAQQAGQDVTTEAYPYGAGMTSIQSALYDNWQSWPDERFGTVQLVSTGERLTRATFAKARAAGGTIIEHSRSDEQTRAAIVSPLTMIASDGFIVNGRGHPRTSGSFAKVLGRYVREERGLGLMDALRKMTIMPVERLEVRVPAMKGKGRLQVGADADITVFDPNTVIDRATYEDATIPSAGIPFVVVGGGVVVDGGAITAARPGRAVRAPVR
jgi:dihydroorotase